MKNWIRWWGIVVFVAILIILCGVWYLWADKIIERNIEKTGEFITGAKVDVGKADLSFVPLGITLKNLQVTDPNSPMNNLFEIDNAKLHLDGKYLFERKVIIEDMIIDGLKFNTPRKKSGEIKGGEVLSVKRVYDKLILPTINLSKLKSFVVEEELESIDRLNDVIAAAERINLEWRQSYANLPTKSDVTAYKRQSAKIVKDIEDNAVKGLLTNAKQIKDLKTAIENDIKTIDNYKRSILNDLDSLQTDKEQALQSLEDDYAKLSKKYTPDIRGLKNFSKYIFKDDILRKIDEGIGWYNKLLPIYDYGNQKIKGDHSASRPLNYEGLDIRLQEFDPQPDFFIKFAKLAFAKTDQDYHGEINNFAFQQNITGLPTTVAIEGNNLDFAESIQFNGSVDHIESDRIRDEFSLSIGRGKFANKKFSILDNWQLELDGGFIDQDYNIIIKNGKIKGSIKLKFHSTTFASLYNGARNKIINSIESVITQVNNFDVVVNIEGMVSNYDLKLSSDLDDRINNAVAALAIQKAEEIKENIRSAINNEREKFVKRFNIQFNKLQNNLVQVDMLDAEIKRIIGELP